MQAEKHYISTMNNQGNMVTQKENNNSPETKLKGDRDLNDREFKFVVMKELNRV